MTNDMTKGSPLKIFILFSIPLLIGNIFQQLYSMVDTIIVGRFVGVDALAAVGSTGSMFFLVNGMILGLTSGFSVLVSQKFGAKDEDGIKKAVASNIKLTVISTIIITAVALLVKNPLLSMMNTPDNILNDANTYITIIFAGIFTQTAYNMAAGILRAFGDSKRPLYVLLVSSCMNILGDLLLVGVLHLGVGGAAAATVAAQIVSVILTFLFLAREEHLRGKVHVWHLHFGREHMVMMIRTGFPLALQSMLFPVSNSIVQASVNTMGTDSIAAWSICDKLSMLIWLLADSMGPAMTTYVAQNLGAEQTERVKKGAFIGTGISVCAVGAVSLFLFFFSGWVGPWFIDKKDAELLIPLVVKYMQMMAPFYLFYAIAEALSGASCGLGETVAPMITTLLSICLLRVCSIWVILPKFETMECIIWIYIASWIVAGLSFIGLFWYKSRRKLQKNR